MKKNNRFKILMIVFLIAVFFTWVFPGKMLAYPKEVIGRTYGIMTLDIVTQYGMGNFKLPLFIIIIGGLYGALRKMPGYINLVVNCKKIFEKKPIMFPIIVTVFFTLLLALTNFSMAFLIFVPFIIKVLKELGFKNTHIGGMILSIFGGSLIGNLTGTMRTQNIYGNLLNVEKFSNMKIKIALLIIILIIQIVFIVKAMGKSVEKQSKKLVSDDPKASTLPYVILFTSTFVLLLLATIPWKDALGIEAFEKIISKANDNNPSFLLKLAGTNAIAFEKWDLVQFTTISLIMSFIVLIFSKFKIDDFLEGFVNGVKEAVKPAMLLFILSAITLVSLYGLFMGNILEPIITKGGYNNFKVYIDYFVNNLFISDPAVASQVVIPYYAGKFANHVEKIALVSQIVLGYFMILLPTSPLLVAYNSKEDITYRDYLVDNSILIIGGIVLTIISLIVI